MKKYLIILCITAFVACNENTADKSAANGDSLNLQVAATTPAATGNNSGDTDCGNQLFFKQGIEIEATTFKADGSVTRKDKTKITNVRNEGGFTIAEAESSEITEGKEPGKTVNYTYKCDGRFFYVDISQLMGSLSTKGAKISVSELSFPINIKEGEQLPEATFNMDMAYGNRTMKSKVTYKERKVEGKETLSFSGKSFSCYKVSSVLDIEMTGLDDRTKQMMETMKAKQPKTKSVMWYAPDAGVLRFDLYMGDALQSYSQVTGVKN